MGKQVADYDEFTYKHHVIQADLGSAIYDHSEGVIEIQGRTVDSRIDVGILLEPEDTVEFNVSVSASEGELTPTDLEFEAELITVYDIETKNEL